MQQGPGPLTWPVDGWWEGFPEEEALGGSVGISTGLREGDSRRLVGKRLVGDL